MDKHSFLVLLLSIVWTGSHTKGGGGIIGNILWRGKVVGVCGDLVTGR